MGDTNDLMEFVSASLGATMVEIYQWLIDCDFAQQEDPRFAMFVITLFNALGRNCPTEVVSMLAFEDYASRGITG